MQPGAQKRRNGDERPRRVKHDRQRSEEETFPTTVSFSSGTESSPTIGASVAMYKLTIHYVAIGGRMVITQAVGE